MHLRRTLLGAALGAVVGAGVGFVPLLELGPFFWAPVLAAVGGFQAWSGHWILRQSGDVPKMKAALPLTGPVLTSIACVFTGEGFLIPVLASIGMGLVLGRILASATASSA